MGWCQSSGTPKECVTAVMKPVGLDESGAHAKASGALLPANQSCASVFLTQQFAVVLISILAG